MEHRPGGATQRSSAASGPSSAPYASQMTGWRSRRPASHPAKGPKIAADTMNTGPADPMRSVNALPLLWSERQCRGPVPRRQAARSAAASQRPPTSTAEECNSLHQSDRWTANCGRDRPRAARPGRTGGARQHHFAAARHQRTVRQPPRVILRTHIGVVTRHLANLQSVLVETSLLLVHPYSPGTISTYRPRFPANRD
jgi:hypothetical protein